MPLRYGHNDFRSARSEPGRGEATRSRVLDAAFQRRSLAFLAQMRERADRLWMGGFWDLGIDRARHLEAQRLVFTTLNGLALERIVVPTMPDTGPDRARLSLGVVAILRADERPEAEGADR